MLPFPDPPRSKVSHVLSDFTYPWGLIYMPTVMFSIYIQTPALLFVGLKVSAKRLCS